MSIEFNARNFFYPISVLRLRAFFERSQWFSQESLIEYEERRLRQIIRHASRHVPYYQDLFRRLRLKPEDVRRVSDLWKLPTLSKTTVRREFARLQAVNKAYYHPRLVQTSGSRGEPVRLLVDKPSNVLEFVYYWRHWNWAGYHLGDRFAEFSSHFFMKETALSDQPYYFQRGVGRLLLNNLSISEGHVEAYVKAIRRYRPLFLKGVPSVLYYFALFLKQKRVTDIHFKGIFSTGEMLLPKQRAFIEETFHGQVYDSYGHMERTVAISECPSGRLHINPEYGILEMVDKRPVDGASFADGHPRIFQARVIGTSLHNFSMPLLRYEVDDFIEAQEYDDACPCGRRMPWVRRINGRCQDVIITPDGRVVTTLFIVFNDVEGISIGQIVQEAANRLRVRIVKSPAYTEDSEARLLNGIRRFVGPAMRVEVEYVSSEVIREAGTGKFRTVVSNLKTNVGFAQAGQPLNERG